MEEESTRYSFTSLEKGFIRSTEETMRQTEHLTKDNRLIGFGMLDKFQMTLKQKLERWWHL